MPEPRRFPAPWRAIELKESYRVEDDNGRPVAFVYFDDRPSIGALNERPTKDEARRIAANIAKLPSILGKA